MCTLTSKSYFFVFKSLSCNMIISLLAYDWIIRLFSVTPAVKLQESSTKKRSCRSQKDKSPQNMMTSIRFNLFVCMNDMIIVNCASLLYFISCGLVWFSFGLLGSATRFIVMKMKKKNLWQDYFYDMMWSVILILYHYHIHISLFSLDT